jgi:hypothetical protein
MLLLSIGSLPRERLASLLIMYEVTARDFVTAFIPRWASDNLLGRYYVLGCLLAKSVAALHQDSSLSSESRDFTLDRAIKLRPVANSLRPRPSRVRGNVSP